MPEIAWFRRDLRLADNPALAAAAARAVASGDNRVIPVFVLDPRVWEPAGPVRRAYLVASLASLRDSLGGVLHVVAGDPARAIPALADRVGAGSVHVAKDFGPYGAARDDAVRDALPGGVEWVATGSPYAVAPGRVTKPDGTRYRVYTPFYRAWLRHGWRSPALDPDRAVEWWAPDDGDALPPAPDLGDLRLPPAGEQAALDRWERFRNGALAEYAELRDRPDVDGTSALSHHLKWGEIHPRTLLADLGEGPGDEAFRREIAWREFYADVIAGRPDAARRSLDPRFDDDLDWDSGRTAEERFEAWAAGRTGYPFVDAGMRQLRAEGWVHNRVRMVVASFLVKDLHLPWQRGAAEFMHWLRDADIASNSQGWQWTAGCGTDASPYHRVFNPVSQGQRFDPTGDYVRRYIPELAHIAGKAAHAPWDTADGYAHGYPQRIVDHAAERTEALARFAARPAR